MVTLKYLLILKRTGEHSASEATESTCHVVFGSEKEITKLQMVKIVQILISAGTFKMWTRSSWECGCVAFFSLSFLSIGSFLVRNKQ